MVLCECLLSVLKERRPNFSTLNVLSLCARGACAALCVCVCTTKVHFLCAVHCQCESKQVKEGACNMKHSAWEALGTSAYKALGTSKAPLVHSFVTRGPQAAR